MDSPGHTSVLQVVIEQSRRVLDTYRIDPGLVQEHANGERRITQGGYGDRQIYELVQNGADELRGGPGGRIAVILTSSYLYCANQGAAITPEGADTILRMGVSRKRGGQIGRFGVGVKSVLSVTDSPEFYSRHEDSSFGFSRDWAEGEIRAVSPDSREIPILRMARPLDPEQAMRDDPVLGELLDWATTVVRLPLKPAQTDRLGSDLAGFPKEFPLFSPHVGDITLEDRRDGRMIGRRMSQRVDGDRRLLEMHKTPGGADTEKWRVFTRTHRPSTRALGDAGELHDRPEIDISWAVPDRPGREAHLGRFWAYFPTNFTTSLRGILNAPWKTSEDRQNLYRSNAFNNELISVSADLVVTSLPGLSRPDDPCAPLDFVPARGREEPQFAADELVTSIWAATTTHPTLPDQNGEFGTARSVRLHPAGLRQQWLALWSARPGRPMAWCHHSVEQTPHRRQSAERILRAAGVPVASAREWLEALVTDGSPESSGAAVRIVADMRREGHELAEEAMKARVILTEEHGLVAPSPNVFRRSTVDELADRMVYVDERIAADPEVRRALDELGVNEADAAGRFASVLSKGFHCYGDAQWTALWELARQAGPADTLTAIRDADIDTPRQVRVRTMAGEFRRIAECLLPGPVVPGDGSRDARIAVDLDFHRPDLPILRDLGLLDGPVVKVTPRKGEPWYDAYVKTYWTMHCKRLPASARRPQMETMRFDGTAPAGPLHFLTELTDEGRAAFLCALPTDGLVTSWTMQVGRQQSTRIAVSSPLTWVSRRYGRLATSRGFRPVHLCTDPRLHLYKDLLPVAEVPTRIAEMLKLPADLSDVPDRLWASLIEEAAESEDDTLPGRIYGLLIESGAAWPEGAPTRCRVGSGWSTEHPDTGIAVTADRDEYDSLVRESLPALLAPTYGIAEVMRRDWGMLAPATVVQKELRHVEQAEPVPLDEEFPHLRISHRTEVSGWTLTRCSELEQIVRTPNGMRTTELSSAIHDRSVLVLRPADDLAALMAVDRELGLSLGADNCRAVLERRERQRSNERLERARKATGDTEKMLELVGEKALKAGLPQGLLESERSESGREPEPHEIAKFALDAFGSGVLRHYRKDIEANIPEAAGRFNGDNRSIQVVNRVGFPEAFAGSREQRLDAAETVQGPREFPRLHDYQERLAGAMVDLLTRYRAGRAMLCLPTGAGKTRIAAEAVIRVIKEQGLSGRPVLWIAQTEELCEQAVQSWKFVWSKVGPEEQLTINRFWRANEAAPTPEAHQLVVATDAKLAKHLDTPEYAWLADPALVLIDEAHASISPRYTDLLRRLGITHRTSERPLIGLTATPYRGFNTDETKRLVQRYGGKRLDEGVFARDPYAELQDLGVLARVEHQELTGATIELDAPELEELEKTAFQNRLPNSAERRIADDGRRNTVLVEAIKGLPDVEPVLLYAMSVDHARLLAALLNRQGIRSATIDSETPTQERRRIIEDYRERRIRVITNYNVLAQGFDAPATKTVVVARPTYSPNVYQQMIGRGLRGPRNGGKEICRILDVQDNITNYDKKLAFTDFEYLWNRR